MRKALIVFIISITFILPCFAAKWVRTSVNVYVDESSITKQNGNNVFYWKRIDKDPQNLYQIPFFDSSSSKTVKSIVYGTQINCKYESSKVSYIYLYDYNGKMVKNAVTDNKNGIYNPEVKTSVLYDTEKALVCNGRMSGLAKLRESLTGQKE